LHWPVKSVNPVKAFEFKVKVCCVINTFRAFISRYFSASVNRINAKELKVPDTDMDALVCPK
jgi:hypothetical protein